MKKRMLIISLIAAIVLIVAGATYLIASNQNKEDTATPNTHATPQTDEGVGVRESV